MLKTFERICRLQTYNLLARSASSYRYVNLNNTNNGYSVIEMKREPVNSFSLEFMQELIHVIDTVEKNDKSRGLVITSNLKIFGAGLDLVEICDSDKKHLKSFWTSFLDLHLRLYTSPLVTMAAINGHAVAAACALTLACDYRIMVDGNYKIGLPTVYTGILVPVWLAKLFKLTIGTKEAEKYLCLGKLSTPQEALSKGLVDKIVSRHDIMSCCANEMNKWLSIPDVGRIKTKQLMRKDFVDEFHKCRDNDLFEFTTMMNDPVFREHLKSYTVRLKSK